MVVYIVQNKPKYCLNSTMQRELTTFSTCPIFMISYMTNLWYLFMTSK